MQNKTQPVGDRPAGPRWPGVRGPSGRSSFPHMRVILGRSLIPLGLRFLICKMGASHWFT